MYRKQRDGTGPEPGFMAIGEGQGETQEGHGKRGGDLRGTAPWVRGCQKRGKRRGLCRRGKRWGGRRLEVSTPGSWRMALELTNGEKCLLLALTLNKCGQSNAMSSGKKNEEEEGVEERQKFQSFDLNQRVVRFFTFFSLGSYYFNF